MGNAQSEQDKKIFEALNNKFPNHIFIKIRGKYLDVTEYQYDHPGGENLLLEHQNADATDDFDEKGHSNEAVKLLKNFTVDVEKVLNIDLSKMG
mmetsp:Transcript_10731/g.15696  ORF Transcript_10731/g.15696 Transcript_10731/m.15696 type:complete len:94 (+) Transcript_10731:53-334(+)